jgi:hypothetical protein
MRPIPRERLEAMRAALQANGPLDRTMRDEILAALPEPGRGKGRPQENKWLSMLILTQLLIERGAEPGAALLAVLPRNATEKHRNRVSKAYQRFQKKGVRIEPLNEKLGASLERIMAWYASEHLKPGRNTRKRSAGHKSG